MSTRETYAALLRDLADTAEDRDRDCRYLVTEEKAAQFLALASLLERVTPEMVNDLRLDIMVMTGCDEPAVGTKDALSVLRALAAGPQQEHGA